jgi:hypothetical protein
MSKLLHKAEVKQGRLLKVANEKARELTRAAGFYYQVWAEDHTDEVPQQEFPLLLTTNEIARALAFAKKRMELIPPERDHGELVWVDNPSRRHKMESDQFIYMWIKNNTGEMLADQVPPGTSAVLRLSRTLLFDSYARGLRNREDVVHKGFFTDLLD